MAKFDSNRFQSTNQSWETPDDLFNKINNIFHFTRDICASSENTKCEKFWSEEDSCLNKKWDGVNWMNPP
jgi:phage N-6-adenine-methyltransferase